MTRVLRRKSEEGGGGGGGVRAQPANVGGSVGIPPRKILNSRCSEIVSGGFFFVFFFCFFLWWWEGGAPPPFPLLGRTLHMTLSYRINKDASPGGITS